MAFDGYLIKIGNQTNAIMHYIIAQSYTVTKKIMDLGSFRDADGILRRTTLEHIPHTISFEVRPCNNKELQKLLNYIRSNFKIQRERKLSITFYDPETDSYLTQDFYMPDPDFPIDHVDKTNIYYRKITLKFIGY